MKFIWFGIKITVHFLLISCVHIQRQLHFKMLLAQNSFCNLIAQVEINSLTYIFISIEKINWINLIVPCPKLIIYSGEHRQVWILDLWGNNLVFSNDSWNPSLVTIFYNPRLQWAFLGPFWGLSGAFFRRRGKNLSHISYHDTTRRSYFLPKGDSKINKLRDTPLEFCWH